MSTFNSIFRACAAAGLLLCAAGCDLDDDNDRDHTPPAGQGALLVDNNTGDDIKVYADGVLLGKVGDYSDRAFDLAPGVYRVVLDEDDGSRDFRDDVDVLADRLTVLDVTVDYDAFDSDYDVEIFFD